jgi:hypothetical protein
MKAVLEAQINKSDRNDARWIAQMMRVGLYRPVHGSQKRRMLLTSRKLPQSKAILITHYPQPGKLSTNHEHSIVSAGLNDGAQQGAISKGAARPSLRFFMEQRISAGRW